MQIKNFKFRNKLLLSFLVVFIPLILISNIFIYFQVQNILASGIEKELQQSSDALADLIQTSAGITVKTRLQAIAEKNFEIAEYYYSKHRSGLLTREQAIRVIEEIFLNQSIGISGYIYCINSAGDVIIHPSDKVKGTNISEFNFVREQMSVKDGYLEYDWQNPGEEGPRPKALFMVYYKPMDWIISVSSYRDEFNYLVDIDEFRELVLSFRSGKSGYAFIIDEAGNALIHPTFQGKNLLNSPFEFSGVIREILTRGNGKFNYQWQNPHETHPREKIIIFRHLPEYHWIIGATSYTEEVFAPLTAFTTLLAVDILFSLLIFTGLTYLVSKSATRPLEQLTRTLETSSQGDYSIRMAHTGTDELGQLGHHFNAFMNRLEGYHDQLNREIQKTVETQAALVENELKLRGLFNQSFQFTFILSPYGILEEVNKSALKFAGCTEAEVLYQPYWDTPWWRHDKTCRDQIKSAVQKSLKGELVRLETTHVTGNGQVRDIDMSVKPILNNSKQVEFIVTEGRDITELKQGEKERHRLAIQLEKSQKMEAIGTLAGGIAHDFNNILSSIFGYAQLAEMTLDTPQKSQKHLSQIVKGAQRASGLVQQILTFSRQTEYKKQPLKIHLVVKEALKLLRSSIPTTIEIRTRVNTRDMVNADPTQMHQVIMNLCTNAYHSMIENGGTLTVSLDTVDHIDHDRLMEDAKQPGPYLRLVVKDTGHGMDKAVLEKAFDPYFTTKEVGRGTGFGLALVHAIVDEHSGLIHVESEPGKGSCFYIYLPVAPEEKPMPSGRQKSGSPGGGTETIMVVDDEPGIRDFTKEFLENFGYTVCCYENGELALEAFTQESNRFDLVITDMTMPFMTGVTLARHILRERKDLPIILCTGYSENISKKEAKEIGIRKYLQKPLQNRQLLSIIRQTLDN
ncbi:MAG: cache domain-containing protein [Desulfobacter sp.]